MPIFIVINVIIISVIVNITCLLLVPIIIVSLASGTNINIVHVRVRNQYKTHDSEDRGLWNDEYKNRRLWLLKKVRKFFRIYKNGTNETLQWRKDKSFIIIISCNEIYFIFYLELIFERTII